MKSLKLSINQTRTVYILVAALTASLVGSIIVSYSEVAHADLTIKTDGTAADSSSAPITLNSCQGALKAITTATAQFKDACGDSSTCIQDIAKCSAGADAAAAGPLSGQTSMDDCSNLVSICPENNAGTSQTYQQAKRDAAGDRSAAQQDLQQATRDFSQQQNQSGQQMLAAQKSILDLGKTHRDTVQNLQNSITNMIAAQDAKKAAAVKDAQKISEDADAEIVKLRELEREKADESQQAQFNWQATCRASAQAKSKAKQDSIDVELKKNEAAVVGGTRNQGSSGIFGLQYRRKYKRNKQIADAYNEELVLCLQGASEKGVEMKIAADTAARNYATAQKNVLDQEALQQSKRTTAQNTMNAAIASTDAETARLTQQATQQIANADQDYQTNLMMAYQQSALAQQNTQGVQQSSLQNLQSTDRRLQEATRDEVVASNQLACANANGGTLSKDQADSAPTSTVNKTKAKKALNDAAGYCDQMESLCTDAAMVNKANAACKQARHAINPSAAGSDDDGVDAARTRQLSSPISAPGAK